MKYINIHTCIREPFIESYFESPFSSFSIQKYTNENYTQKIENVIKSDNVKGRFQAYIC